MFYDHVICSSKSHQYASTGTKVKVICLGQGQISRLHFSKNGCFRGISVSQTYLAEPALVLRLAATWTSLPHKKSLQWSNWM